MNAKIPAFRDRGTRAGQGGETSSLIFLSDHIPMVIRRSARPWTYWTAKHPLRYRHAPSAQMQRRLSILVL